MIMLDFDFADEILKYCTSIHLKAADRFVRVMLLLDIRLHSGRITKSPGRRKRI